MSEQDGDGFLNKWPLGRIGSSSEWFVQQLTDHGITMRADSGVGRALDKLRQLRDSTLQNRPLQITPRAAAYAFLSGAFGADFLAKSLHWGHDSGLRMPVERWRDLVKSNPVVTARASSAPQRNRTWEVIIASLMRAARALSRLHPGPRRRQPAD